MKGTIQDNVPLAPMTAYRIGGCARYYSSPGSLDELIRSLRWAEAENLQVFILGAGTNVLFSDRGFDGLILHLRGFNYDPGKLNQDNTWEVGAGAMLTPWVRRTVWAGCSGVEDLIGIPGTVGGALCMNAGAYSQEICQSLVSVEVLTEELEVKQLKVEDIGFAYRHAPGLKGKLVLSAKFRFETGERDRLIAGIRDTIQRRRNRQPLEFPSCGSVFKRPAGDYAGRLIEEAGLKGLTCGGAQISQKHANFIINYKSAKAEDVLYLIKAAGKKVKEEFGVTLEREVILLGFTEEELNGT